MILPILNISLSIVNSALAVDAHKRAKATTCPKRKAQLKCTRNVGVAVSVLGAVVGAWGVAYRLNNEE